MADFKLVDEKDGKREFAPRGAEAQGIRRITLDDAAEGCDYLTLYDYTERIVSRGEALKFIDGHQQHSAADPPPTLAEN